MPKIRYLFLLVLTLIFVLLFLTYKNLYSNQKSFQSSPQIINSTPNTNVVSSKTGSISCESFKKILSTIKLKDSWECEGSDGQIRLIDTPSKLILWDFYDFSLLPKTFSDSYNTQKCINQDVKIKTKNNGILEYCVTYSFDEPVKFIAYKGSFTKNDKIIYFQFESSPGLSYPDGVQNVSDKTKNNIINQLSKLHIPNFIDNLDIFDTLEIGK